MFRKLRVGTLPFLVAAVLLGGAPPARAAVYDLLSAGQSQSLAAANIGAGAIAIQSNNDSSTGTGTINSFVRVHSGGSVASESGLNSTNVNLFDSNNGHNFARTLSDVPYVVIGTTYYREFRVDLNEPNSNTNHIVGINQIQIFARTGDLTDPTVGSGHQVSVLQAAAAAPPTDLAPVIQIAGATEIFRLSGIGVTGNAIRIDEGLDNGSGSGDMRLLIPDALFVGLSPTTDIILYSQFGTPPNTVTGGGQAGGFEEWYVRQNNTPPPPTTSTPEPTTLGMALVGLAGFGIAKLRRSRRQKAVLA